MLNISSRVASWGQGGLMAIDVVASSVVNVSWLYTTYMALPAGAPAWCNDNGTVAGRPPAAVLGCPVAGVLSRWPLAAGAITGPEEILAGGNLSAACSQFGFSNIGYVLANATDVLFSVGVGENENAVPDVGQFGGDPCGSGGAFRALTPVGSQPNGPLGGKVLHLNLATRALTTLATGLHNPWRFTVSEAQAAFYTADCDVSQEINGPALLSPAGAAAAPNYGYPCWDGRAPYAAFQAANASGCAALAAPAAVTPPYFSYSAATFSASAASISALTLRASTGTFYFGDYTLGKIYTLSASSNATLATVKSFVYPSDIAYVPGVGIVYADAGHGTLASLPGTLDASPTPSVTPSPGAGAASDATAAATVSTLTGLAALAALVAAL